VRISRRSRDRPLIAEARKTVRRRAAGHRQEDRGPPGASEVEESPVFSICPPDCARCSSRHVNRRDKQRLSQVLSKAVSPIHEIVPFPSGRQGAMNVLLPIVGECGAWWRSSRDRAGRVSVPMGCSPAEEH